MNVYDFDNTIYDGESVVDFYLFCVKKHPGLITIFPKVIYMLLRYKALKITEQELIFEAEKYINALFEKIDFEALVPEFWDKHQNKIKRFYLDNKREDDVVISASADFLVGEMCKRLGIKTVIASSFDRNTKKVTRLCFRGRKVEIFKEFFPDGRIDNFYTDSLNDAPMFELSDRVFMVKGNKVKEIKK